MIILTFANNEIRSMKKMLADPESVEAKFNERIEEWKSQIVQYLHKEDSIYIKMSD